MRSRGASPIARKSRAARSSDSGSGGNFTSAASKCVASDAAMDITVDAVQLLGGYGYTRDFPAERLSASARRELFKEQYLMLLLDEERSLAALPKLVPQAADREAALETVRRVLTARGELTPARKVRLARVEAILMNGVAAARQRAS